MTSVQADYFDGKSARRQLATITVIGLRVLVDVDGVSTDYERGAVRIMPRVSGTPRRLEFSDGGVAMVADSAAFTVAFGASSDTLAHRLESRLGFVAASLAGVVIALLLGYVYGIPLVAREVAVRLPAGIESQLAETSLETLDRAIFEPSALPFKQQSELLATFAQLRIASGLPASVRLVVRNGGLIGANALALPGGTVVVTDELVQIMPDIDATASVLAHELGHVHHRHSLQQVLQSSIAALVAMVVYGDVGSLTTVIVAAPASLAQSAYSRGFEREADAFAFALLKRTGRSPRAFAAAMIALDNSQRAGQSKVKWREKLGLPEPEATPSAQPPEQQPVPNRDEAEGFGYLSTHPATEQRIRAAEAAAEE